MHSQQEPTTTGWGYSKHRRCLTFWGAILCRPHCMWMAVTGYYTY